MGEQHHDPKIIVEYSKAVILNPTFLEGYNNLGRTLARVGQMSQADRIYHRALKIDPNSAVVLNNFGLLKKIDDDIEQAILLFEKAIAIDSKYKKARINLANSLMMAKRFEPALIHYDLLNITQSRAQVLEVLYILERYDELIARLKVLVKQDRSNIRVSAVSVFASNQIGFYNPYDFCREPLKFLQISNIRDYRSDSEAFIKSIEKEVLAKDLVWEPGNKTTKFGFQTDDTVFQTGPACCELEKILHDALDAITRSFVKATVFL